MPETRESLGKIEIFLHREFDFPQRLSNFYQLLSVFLNGFLLSSMDFQFSSMAFHFPRNPRKSIYGGKYPKDHYSSFVFPATCSSSFVIPATMSTSPPTSIPRLMVPLPPPRLKILVVTKLLSVILPCPQMTLRRHWQTSA